MKLKVEQVKWITEHLKKMNRRKIIFRDPVVERVVDKFVERSNVGFDKIRDWANERGLYSGGDTKTQTLKLMEEAGEICRAVLKKDEPEIIDGIGDCVVVLTNLAHLCDTSIEECIKAAYDEIKGRSGKMVNGTFKKD